MIRKDFLILLLLQVAVSVFSLNNKTANANAMGKVILSNGIEVTMVSAKGESTTVAINIAGGLCISKQKSGLDALITQIYATNIANELKDAQLGDVKVTNSTGDYQSAIFIDCKARDLQNTLTAAGHALIYGKISVEDAERMVEAAKRKKRQDNMNVFSQLYAAGLKKLYGSSSPYFKAYDTGEILQGVTFNDIEALTVTFLNAALYSIVITGDVIDGIGGILEASFGDLKVTGDAPVPFTDNTVIKKDDVVRVKVQRVFKGDGKTGDAMPEVLVPTKEFFDPMLFFIKGNDFNQKVFTNAINLLVSSLNNNNDSLFESVEVLKRADCVTIVLDGVKNKSKCAALFAASKKNARALKETHFIRVETY